MIPGPWAVRFLTRRGRVPFRESMTALDEPGRRAVYQRVDRMRAGNFGDHRDVGGGVWELRIHHGPGYRVYYAPEAGRVVVLLCAGLKRTQDGDIARARLLWGAR